MRRCSRIDSLILQLSAVYFLLFPAGLAVAQTMDCDLCGQTIHGQYYVYRSEADETVVCRECNEQCGRCMLCGVPVAGTTRDQKEVLCEVCRQSARYCCVCNKLIEGAAYSDSRGHVFCDSCRQKAPRCAGCNGVLVPGEVIRSHGLGLCRQCNEQITRCRTCGVPLVRALVTFEGFDGAYCRHCADTLPKCISCTRPSGPGSRQIDRYTWICPDCAATAVIELSDLRALAHEIRDHLASNLLMPIKHAVDIDFSLHGGKKSAGFKESGRFIESGSDYRIAVQKGLSRDICIETLAHEFAHAWQRENIPGLTSEKWREGFAQWVAAQVLLDYGKNYLIPRIENRDDVYGRGYRLMKEIQAEKGIEGLFKTLRNKGR